MTRLFDTPHGQVQEFFKKLAVVGFTSEHIRYLNRDSHAMERWVRSLDADVPPEEDVSVDEAFGADTGVRLLLRRNNLNGLREIAMCCEGELKAIRGMGSAKFMAVEVVLHLHGYTLMRQHPQGGCLLVREVHGGEVIARRETVGRLLLSRCLSGNYRANAVEGMRVNYEQLTVDEALMMSERLLAQVLNPSGLKDFKKWRRDNGL